MQFELVLAAGIAYMLSVYDEYYLDCDYNAPWLLMYVAKYLDVDLYMRLPIKTSMRISNRTIECKLGYGAPYEVIYTTPTI